MLKNIAVNNMGRIVLTTNHSGTLHTSSNGLDWDKITIPAADKSFVCSIATFKDKFIVSAFSEIITSTDGKIWNSIPQEKWLQKMAVKVDNKYIAFNNFQKIITSTDGKTWTILSK
ncbi:MAG: hypothetical protein K0R49_1002 [Burkholderiales bacterium]|jgi:hypothetical protein|nr:hypothetical protein [Burkholderiales bacterium]